MPLHFSSGEGHASSVPYKGEPCLHGAAVATTMPLQAVGERAMFPRCSRGKSHASIVGRERELGYFSTVEGKTVHASEVQRGGKPCPYSTIRERAMPLQCQKGRSHAFTVRRERHLCYGRKESLASTVWWEKALL